MSVFQSLTHFFSLFFFSTVRFYLDRFFFMTVKIKNMNNAEVHSFHSHTKPVTGLTLYPYGPLIVSCALDWTVRIWSLKSFREVYR